AVAFCEVASLPASGSERQNAPITSPFANGTRYFCFCSSLQYFSIPAHTTELFTDIITAAEASTFAFSAIPKTQATLSNPLPPYFGSTIIPKKPSSAIFFTCSAGKIWCSSRSITPGNSSCCAKSRAACCIICCSSVRLKFIIVLFYVCCMMLMYIKKLYNFLVRCGQKYVFDNKNQRN